MTPSQRRKANRSIVNYMLSNGYNETVECFKKEADVPDEDPNEVTLQVESEKNTASDVPTCHTPWFILNITVIQCSWFLMGISIDPFLFDPFR